MSRANRSARTRRSAKKDQLSEALLEAMSLTRTTQAAAARAIGVCETLVSKWKNPEQHDAISMADVAMMATSRHTREAGLDLVRWLARDFGADVVKRLEVSTIADHIQLIADMSREMGEAMAAEAAGCADGRWEAHEHDRAAAEWWDVARKATAAAEYHEREARGMRALRVTR